MRSSNFTEIAISEAITAWTSLRDVYLNHKRCLQPARGIFAIIQWSTLHMLNKQVIDLQFFNRKSISRNTAHRQYLNLQAMLTSENLKG